MEGLPQEKAQWPLVGGGEEGCGFIFGSTALFVQGDGDNDRTDLEHVRDHQNSVCLAP